MPILLNAIKSDFEVCTDISVKGHLYQAARRSAAQNRELVNAVHTDNPLLCISSICFTGTLDWLLRIRYGHCRVRQCLWVCSRLLLCSDIEFPCISCTVGAPWSNVSHCHMREGVRS